MIEAPAWDSHTCLHTHSLVYMCSVVCKYLFALSMHHVQPAHERGSVLACINQVHIVALLCTGARPAASRCQVPGLREPR